MKSSLRSRLNAAFLAGATLVASSSSLFANDDWHRRPNPPGAPEVGTWLIGAGMLALLGFDLARRKFASRTKSVS